MILGKPHDVTVRPFHNAELYFILIKLSRYLRVIKRICNPVPFLVLRLVNIEKSWLKIFTLSGLDINLFSDFKWTCNCFALKYSTVPR